MENNDKDAVRRQALVIEDDPLLNGLFRRWLERLGHEARGFASGAEALEWLGAATAPPDLIILDQHLSDTNGATLYPKLRVFAPDARIVVCSAFEPEGLLAAEYRARKIGRVKKPCYLADFEAALGEASAPASTTKN